MTEKEREVSTPAISARLQMQGATLATRPRSYKLLDCTKLRLACLSAGSSRHQQSEAALLR